MNKTTKKTILAVILNIALPGAGYIYLRAKRRVWLAIPLLLLSIYDIGYVCFVFFTGSHYSYSQNLSPFTQSGMVNLTVYSWFVFLIISIDTWSVANGIFRPAKVDH